MSVLVLYADETDPDTRLAWYAEDGSGDLRDFTGWTLSVEIVSADGSLVDTKTTGVSGGDGSEASNVNIAWTAAELGDLAGSTYQLRVKAVSGAETAVFTIDARHSLPRLAVLSVPA